MKNGQLKPGYNIQAATTNQYIVDFALFPNPTDFRTFEPFLDQMKSRGFLDKFQNIVADVGYGSEYNYSILEENYSDKNYQIPYTQYEKEQTRKYKKDPSKVDNWYYNEEEDYYVDKSGVRFNFKYYSQRKDRSTGMVRNFKIYEADEFQLTEELTQLAKTKTGRQRQIHYNPNWQYLKEKAKETLKSEEGKRIYGCRKSDVEPIFGHMKSVFGMRRTHLRGKKKVETDVGIMFMTINLKKYGANKKVKPSNFHFKNKKHRNSLKIMNFCVFISGLKIEFFPRHFLVYLNYFSQNPIFILNSLKLGTLFFVLLQKLQANWNFSVFKFWLAENSSWNIKNTKLLFNWFRMSN